MNASPRLMATFVPIREPGYRATRPGTWTGLELFGCLVWLPLLDVLRNFTFNERTPLDAGLSHVVSGVTSN